MSKDTTVLSDIAVFLAGMVAANLMTGRRRDQAPAAPATPATAAESPEVQGLQRAIAHLESRLAGQELTTAARLGQLESRIEQQTARIAETPTTQQIVGAMEQLLSKTMASLDTRLTTQAHSIELLKTSVSQTDGLLERVLESLDSLQSYVEPLDLTGDPLLRQAV